MPIPRLGELPSPASGSAGEGITEPANIGKFGARSVRRLNSREEPWSALNQRVSSALRAGFAMQDILSQTFENGLGAPTPSFFEGLGTPSALPPGDLFFDRSFDRFMDYQQIIPLVTQKLAAGVRESALKSTTAGFENAPVLIQYEGVFDRRFQDTLTQPSGQFLNHERYKSPPDTAPINNPLSPFEPSVAFGEASWPASLSGGELDGLLEAQSHPFRGGLAELSSRSLAVEESLPFEEEFFNVSAIFATPEAAPQFVQPAPLPPDTQGNGLWGRSDEMPQGVDAVDLDRDATSSEASSDQETSAEDVRVLKKAERRKKWAGYERMRNRKLRKGRGLLQEKKSGKILSPDEQKLVDLYLRRLALNKENAKKYRAKRPAKKSQEERDVPKIYREKVWQGKVLFQEKERGRPLNPDEQELVDLYLRDFTLTKQREDTCRKRKTKAAQEGEGAPKTHREKFREGRELFQKKTSGKLLNPDEQKLVDFYLQDRTWTLAAQIAKTAPSLPIVDPSQNRPQEALCLNNRKLTSQQRKQTELLLLQEGSLRILTSEEQRFLADLNEARDKNARSSREAKAKRLKETQPAGLLP